MLFNPFRSDLNMYLIQLHKLDHFRNWINRHVVEPVFSFPSYYLIINMPVRFCIRTFFNGLSLYLTYEIQNPLLLIFFSAFRYVWTFFQLVLSSFQQHECFCITLYFQIKYYKGLKKYFAGHCIAVLGKF